MKRLACAILLLSGVAWGQAPGWVTYSYDPQAKSPAVTALPPQHVRVKAGLAILASKATTEVSFDWDERLVQDGWVYEDSAKRTLVLTSPVAGTYRVTATWFEPAKGKFKEVWYVTFEQGPLPPPGPDPPPPPETLETRMLKEYQADRADGKVADAEMRVLVEVFKNADQFFGVTPTTGALYQLMDFGLKAAAPKLDRVKGVIDAHLEKVAPRVKDVPLTDALKAALKVAFGELARAVEACLAPLPPPGPKPGARTVLLVRETNDSTPELRAAVVALRAGPHADYLKSKGHTLTVLDDDAVGPDGQPAPILVKWRPHYQGLTLPALVVADAAGNVVHKATLPDKATAEQIMDLIKKAGG